LLAVNSSAPFTSETSFGQVTAKKASKNVDFFKKSEVTLFTPKISSILAQNKKSTFPNMENHTLLNSQ